MNVKKVGFLCGLILNFLPMFAYATDIYLYNDTNSPLTGHAGFLCSSNVDGVGSLDPKKGVNITRDDIKKFCPFGSCDVDIYMNRNCSGRSVSTVTVNKDKGVTNVSNHDVDGYYAKGGGGWLTVSGGPARKWYDIFFS